VEHTLPGGYVNSVVRVGDTVRRPPSRARGLLQHLEARGFTGAPRHLGLDDQGREVLSFLDGHVAWEPEQPSSVREEASLIAAARLVRTFHDLTAGTSLAADQEVVCHNDLSPKNTVYRDLGSGLRPVAFIDWDLAAPGPRIHDVAHVAWQFVGLGPAITDLAEAARLVHAIADAYGLPADAPLIDAVLWWQDRCWRGIESAAAAGDPAMVRLRNQGAAQHVHDAYTWTRLHRKTLSIH
jgi:Ser/Thr protein kinase RdoA (MazF antagonist)